MCLSVCKLNPNCKKATDAGDDWWWLLLVMIGEMDSSVGNGWCDKWSNPNLVDVEGSLLGWWETAGWWTWTATVFAEQSPGENPPGNNKKSDACENLWVMGVDVFLFKLIKQVGKYSLSLPGQLFCWVVVSNIFYVHLYFGKWSHLIILPARTITEVSPGLNFCFHSQECSGSSHFSFK